MLLHPIPGHQGRFAASHALACVGKITEYQVQRRRRTWVPGVQSPGRPNDYINLFLVRRITSDETVWARYVMAIRWCVCLCLRRRR
jgi:hypothetical protein